jgi:hypothetical protein
MSEHNPLKPDIHFFSNSSDSSHAIGSAKFRGASNLRLILQDGEERIMQIASKDRDYWFDLPDSSVSDTGRKVLWKRLNVGGGGPVTGKGNRALVYELRDEGSREVLAVYDESEEGKTDLSERGKLVLNPELQIGGGNSQGLWVLMGALGICEKTRRRAGK